MQKLELTWIGKGNEPKIEPRILLHDASKDYGDPTADNMLIHGDNLLALKALEQQFAGQVKCIYIDPPYNTGSAFEHYDDNLEHSIWLGLMKARLEILRNLLKKDGTIWITLDDGEVHYCKILCDEIWGRKNFIADISWNSRKSVSNDAIISMNTNHILVYATDAEVIRTKAKRSEMFKGPMNESKFSNPDNDPFGEWVADPMDAPNLRPNLTYPITNPITGEQHLPPSGRCWRITQEKFSSALAAGRIIFGKNGTSKPQLKRYLNECMEKGTVMTTLWADLGTTTNATKHSQQLFDGKSFTNPKPEDLIERILMLATSPGDLVLDSFLGSGTTAAVAHKMGRRYIGIELGEHCYTHCLPRLQKVVDGEQGGISKSANWQGGGGFKFYELAPTLIVKDKHGNDVFSDKYNNMMLCAAVAKLNGFMFAPDAEIFWKQGASQDNSFIYVTTNYFTMSMLDEIANDVSDFNSLLICAPAFDVGLGKRYGNINVRKIPQSVLNKCEYGVDNYNLNIVNPPELDEEEWEDVE